MIARVMRSMNKKRRIAVLSGAAAGIVVLCGVAGAAYASSTAEGDRISGRSSAVSSEVANEYAAKLKALTSEFPEVDQVSVVALTLADLAKDGIFDATEAYPADTSVIVATGVGEFVPSFGSAAGTPPRSWGAVVFDAESGQPLGAFSLNGDIPAPLLG